MFTNIKKPACNTCSKLDLAPVSWEKKGVCVCVLYIFKNRIRERKVAYYNGSHWHNEYVENGQVSKALSLKEQAMSYHVQSIPQGDNLKQKKLCEWCYK